MAGNKNPAPVSGPGKLSKRTDGGPTQKLMAPTGMEYGGQKTLLDQERGGAMAQADSQPTAQIPSGGPSAPAGAPYTGPGMGDPTARPNEPTTAGVDSGEGPGPEAMAGPASPMPSGELTDILGQAQTTDMTGTLGALFLMAQQRNV